MPPEPRFAPELPEDERLVEADRDDAFDDDPLADFDRPPVLRADEAFAPPEARVDRLLDDEAFAPPREPPRADDLLMDERPLDDRLPADFLADDLPPDDLRAEDFPRDDFFAEDLPRDDAPPLPRLPRDEPLDLAFAIEPPSCGSRRVDCCFYHSRPWNGNISADFAQSKSTRH